MPLRNAMNEVLRDAYVEDCQRGVDRWNKRLAEAGRRRSACACPASASTATSASTPACPSTPTASSLDRDGVGRAARPSGCPPTTTAPTWPRLHEAGARAGQDRQLDRPARPRHQGPALRVRVRPAGLSRLRNRCCADRLGPSSRGAMRTAAVALVVMLALFATPGAARGDSDPAAVVHQFYEKYIKLSPPGLPTAAQQKELAPYLSRRLLGLMDGARAYQEQEQKKHPDEKPPFVDGCLFASLFEGPKSFKVGAAVAEGQGSKVKVHFKADQDVAWDDEVVVIKRRWTRCNRRRPAVGHRPVQPRRVGSPRTWNRAASSARHERREEGEKADRKRRRGRLCGGLRRRGGGRRGRERRGHGRLPPWWAGRAGRSGGLAAQPASLALRGRGGVSRSGACRPARRRVTASLAEPPAPQRGALRRRARPGDTAAPRRRQPGLLEVRAARPVAVGRGSCRNRRGRDDGGSHRWRLASLRIKDPRGCVARLRLPRWR